MEEEVGVQEEFKADKGGAAPGDMPTASSFQLVSSPASAHSDSQLLCCKEASLAITYATPRCLSSPPLVYDLLPQLVLHFLSL
jgi:hypothetical protein